MDEVMIQAFYFYITAIASGAVIGTVATIMYAGLYSLRK